MSLDRTLKSHGALLGRRSVLTRAERIEKLVEEGEFDMEADSPLGLPKVRTVGLNIGGATSEEEAEATAAAEEIAEAPAEEE
jgi:small basic protein (TIGR04137 family)